MANEEQLAILEQGVEVWNKWRRENPAQGIDLSKAILSEVNLRGANLRGVNLRSADLSKADLREAILVETHLTRANLKGADLSGSLLRGAFLSEANLSKAILRKAILRGADIRGSDLRGADCSDADFGKAHLNDAILISADLSGTDLIGTNLSGANLSKANLSEANVSLAILQKANLSKANLTGADLIGANLIGTKLKGANLSEATLWFATLAGTDLTRATLDCCKIYGISAWNLELEGAQQSNLVITSGDEPTVTVDNLEVAQFVYLLLNNENIRHVIDTITSKVVLILGRFTEERKSVLESLREELRKRDYSPIVFDFEKPSSRDLSETVSTLAHMARFVIADITDAKAIPQELQKIVPNLPSLPIQPIILESQDEYGMFKDFGGYLSVLPPFRYANNDDLLMSLEEKVIAPALNKAEEITERRKAFEQELARA